MDGLMGLYMFYALVEAMVGHPASVLIPLFFLGGRVWLTHGVCVFWDGRLRCPPRVRTPFAKANTGPNEGFSAHFTVRFLHSAAERKGGLMSACWRGNGFGPSCTLFWGAGGENYGTEMLPRMLLYEYLLVLYVFSRRARR